MILYMLYRIGIMLALALPLKISYRIASFLADVFCMISKRDSLALAQNLRVVFGNNIDDARLNILIKRVFRNFAKYLVDFFRFSNIDEAYIRKMVKMTGQANIDTALKKGKGGILLSAHIGNWEMGGAALSLTGYPVNAVALTHQNRKINDFFLSQRHKVKMIPIEIGATLRACYRTLRKNGLLALLGDRDFTKNGIVIDFFGRKALIPRGPGVLSYREGAAILPVFITRRPDDSFLLAISEPIYTDRTKEEEEAIRDVTARYLISIESCIREHPDQWYAFRQIWGLDEKQSMRPDTII